MTTSPRATVRLATTASLGTALAIVLGAATLSFSTPALADGNADRADALNEEGKQLMFANQYADAGDKFAQATTLSPQARFYFNLCMARFQQGMLRDAMVACDAVGKNAPDATLQDKTTKLIGKINDAAQAQGINLTSTNPTPNPANPTPSNPTPNPANPTPNNPPPNPANPNAQPIGYIQPNGGQPNLFQPAEPSNQYAWSLGAQLIFANGQFGQKGFYDTAAVGIRGIFDLALSKTGSGLEFNLDYLNVNASGSISGGGTVETLEMFGIGAGLYKNFCRGRLCFTPSIGLQLAFFENQSLDSNFLTAIGARAEARVAYVFGPNYENEMHIGIGAEVFSPTFGGAAGASPADEGLDTGTYFGYFGLGYTRRFSTPLGNRPFFTLE